MGKTMKQPSNHQVKVKLKNTRAFVLKGPVRVTGSLQTAAVIQPAQTLVPPALPPHIAQISALNDKLILAHNSLECRLRLCEATINENTALKIELHQLTNTLNQAKLTHQHEINEVKSTSFLEGQGAIVGELKKLMTSKEFAAELMWGKNCLSTHSKLTLQIDQVAGGKRTDNMMPSEGLWATHI